MKNPGQWKLDARQNATNCCWQHDQKSCRRTWITLATPSAPRGSVPSAQLMLRPPAYCRSRALPWLTCYWRLSSPTSQPQLRVALSHIWLYMIIHYHIWAYMIIYDRTWSYMSIYDHIWSYRIIYDHIWAYIIIHDHIWAYMIICDHTWSYMSIHDHIYEHIWSYMIIHDHISAYMNIYDYT